MAETTPNFNLTKPDLDDFYDINVFNTNADTIDAALEEAGSDNVSKSGDTMTGTLVSTATPGFQGSLTGNATSATKLQTQRDMRVNLAKTTGQTFDGTANATDIGVSGVLPIAQGGTGSNTPSGGANNLFTNNVLGSISTIPVFDATGSACKQSPPSFRDGLGLGNTTGALPIANGGTGTNNAAQARINLGVASAGHAHAASDITSGVLGVARGGTGNSNPLDELDRLFGTASSISGALISNGGSGTVISYAQMRNNLGLGNTTEVLPIANGGTGNTTGSVPYATSAGSATTAASASYATSAGSAMTAAVSNSQNYTTGIPQGGTGAQDAANARANLGLGNVNNTSDSTKSVNFAVTAGNCTNAYSSQFATSAASTNQTTVFNLKNMAIQAAGTESIAANAITFIY